jgi:nucleotide-binding universal stress UspA family protein
VAKVIAQILVPVDFSACSRKAAEHAAQLAHVTKASVTLLHAWHGPRADTDLSEWWESLRQEERAASLASYVTAEQQGRLNELAVLVRRAGVSEVETTLVEGKATKAILERAPDFDLVVMGTHGRSGVSGWLIGSVAERVVRHSPTPVLVVPERWSASAAPP